MKRKNPYYLLLFMLPWVYVSCSVQKYIPEGEQLYKGSKIEIVDKQNAVDVKSIKDELEDLLRPEPNKSLLGIKFRLWAYFSAAGKNSNFITRYFNKKFGEEPVYLSQVDSDRNRAILTNRLENKGYFYAQVSFQREGAMQEKPCIRYTISLNQPYTLNKHIYEGPDNTLGKHIQASMKQSLLHSGHRYDLNQIKQERERIASYLLEIGYYNFSPGIFLYSVDTSTSGDKKIDLYLQIKPDAPTEALTPYRLSDMYIYPDYGLQTDSTITKDTVVYNGYTVIQNGTQYAPKRFDDYLLIRPGDIYKQSRSDRTRQRLFGIGSFGFVNIRYQVPQNSTPDSTGHLPLEAHIYLSPLSKRSVSSELQAVSKSNNFMGPLLNLDYKNRNTFKGGELITLGGHIGYETQINGGKSTGLSALEAGLHGELSFPRIIAPFDWNTNFLYGNQRTQISASFNYLNRVNFYQLNSLSLGYGYLWIASRFAYHEIRPLALNYTRLSRTSDAFKEILDANAFLQRSFEQRFIPGLEYKFTFNELGMISRRYHYLVFFNLDISGNILYLSQSILGIENPNNFFGSEFARYARIDVDVRNYRKVGRDQNLIMRIYSGYGVPLGQSQSLPFIKQYFSGGPNSVRSFRIRSLGPGTYQPEQTGSTSFFDQSGDIRFEANIEYRFPIMRYLNGAVFGDAGNIWLAKDNPDIPGGKFSSSWLRELGVGVGFGVRLDVNFFVLRLDLATPIRKPWLPKNERWSTSFNYGNSTWRKENLIWNFAIGYPF